MNFFFHKGEIANEDDSNVRSFINDTYCTITKAAAQERIHDHFIIQHAWQILNISLLAFFDDTNKSECKIKMKSKNSISSSYQEEQSKDSNNDTDENLLSISAKAFAILSHASNLIIQCLTSKQYFYRLATTFLRNRIDEKNNTTCLSKNCSCSTTDSKKINNIDDSQSSANQSDNYSITPNCEEVNDIINNDDNNWLLPPDVVISRLATIFQNIITQDSDHMKESAQLILLFIPFADNSGVFDLLSTSLSLDIIKPIFFHHLIKLGLVNELLTNICKLKVGNRRIDEATIMPYKNIQDIDELKFDPNCFDADYSVCVSNDLCILSIIAKNKYLFQSINESNHIFSVLSQFASMNNLETYITNNLWRAISAVCNEQSIKNHGTFLRFLFLKAMRIISEPYVTLNIFHTYAMDFLGKIMKYEPKLFLENELLMLESIIEVISRLIGQFPDSTNLQSSIARFIIYSLSHGQSSSLFSNLFSNSSTSSHSIIVERIIKNLFPLFIMTAQSKHYRSAASANCVCIMYRASLMCSSNSLISQFCASSNLYKVFMDNFMNDYAVKLGSNYGGTVDERTPPLTTVSKISNEYRMNHNHAIFV